MDELKKKIANEIRISLEQDFPQYKDQLILDSHNYVGGLKSDAINTRLNKDFKSDNYIIHGFKRCAWEGRFIIELDSKSIISITSISNLERVSKDKNRKVPHYMQSILNYLNDDIESERQITFEVGKTFDDDIYEKDFKNIFSKLKLDFKDFTYYVVAYDYSFGKVHEMNWYLLDNEFNVANKESMMKFIDPDFIDLTDVENDFNVTSTEGEAEEPSKGIKLGLKKKKIKKHG